MALRGILILGLWIFPVALWGKGEDSHAHSASTHEHASSAPSSPPEAAPALTSEQQAHLETSFEECSHNAYTLKATQKKYCMATDGSFKACESPGKFLDPEQFPPDSTSSLALLNQYFKCAYCRPGGNVTFTQTKCMNASRDLIQMEQLQTEADQKAFEDKVKYYLEDLPQGLVTATQVGMKAYESYKKLRKAFEDLKGKKKEPPPPPPPGEEPIGPEFFWPPPPPPPPAEAPPPQPFGQGGATQTARADGGNKGGKFLGFGEDKKSKDKGGRKSADAAPAGGGSGGGGGGSVGGSGGGGGEAGALSSGSSGGVPGGPTDMSDKNVAFGSGGSGPGGGGSNAIENQLLGELLSEDNKVKSRLQGGGPREGAGTSATSGARTGIVLLLERIRYTTEKTMGEIYIPTSSEE